MSPWYESLRTGSARRPRPPREAPPRGAPPRRAAPPGTEPPEAPLPEVPPPEPPLPEPPLPEPPLPEAPPAEVPPAEAPPRAGPGRGAPPPVAPPEAAVRGLLLGAAISVQHRGVLAEPAGPGGCPPPPFTRRLDITEPDRGGPGADQDRGAQDPHLARGEGTGGRRVLRGRVDRPQLQPGLPQHGPGPRAGGAGAELAGHRDGRLVPAHPGIPRSDLGSEAHSLGGLGPCFPLPGLDSVQGGHQQVGTGYRPPSA